MSEKLKIAAVSLGCDKNRVDTEHMLYRLSAAGHSFTNDYRNADVLIVNTCAFIESARREAVDTILELAAYKAENPRKKLIVTGCLPQKYLDEIKDELSEVDAFLGVKDYDTVDRVIDSLFQSGERVFLTVGADKPDQENRYVTTPAHYAHLRIADGCDNRCTYCLIPSIRGAYHSRSMESLLTEAARLVETGARELILVAQDVTRYGIDRYGSYKLIELLQRITTETAVEKVRLMYCYPELVTDDLLNEIVQNPKIAKYIDIPFQHADDRILRLMNRRSTRASLAALMERIRALKTHIAVRTTFMVGFPGETEAEFQTLYDFVQSFRPDHVGVFAYSKEAETPSAKFKGHLTKPVKRARVRRLGELHLASCRARNQALIGSKIKVVYEGIDYGRNLFIGRSEFSAPDIDTYVYFSGDFADIGHTYMVKITGYDDYDLLGELTDS